MKKPIVFFDGVCSLCNGFVDFIFKFDTREQIQVSSLQGKTAAENLPKEYLLDLDTVVFIQEDRIYTKSSAVLRVLLLLPFPWPVMGIFLLVPKVIRDFFYMLISRNRYRVFGKSNSCRLATPSEKARFLD